VRDVLAQVLPEQKAGPAPVSTTARVRSSPAAVAQRLQQGDFCLVGQGITGGPGG